MDEFERVALRRLADGDFAVRRVLRRLGDRHGGLELEAGIVGRGEDRHRQAVGLEALLVDIGFELLERRGDRLEGVVPGAGALHVHDRLCGQRRVLAERIARLGRRCRAGAAGAAAGCASGRAGLVGKRGCLRRRGGWCSRGVSAQDRCGTPTAVVAAIAAQSARRRNISFSSYRSSLPVSSCLDSSRVTLARTPKRRRPRQSSPLARHRQVLI